MFCDLSSNSVGTVTSTFVSVQSPVRLPAPTEIVQRSQETLKLKTKLSENLYRIWLPEDPPFSTGGRPFFNRKLN